MDRTKQVDTSGSEQVDLQKFYAQQLEQAEQRVQDLRNTLSKLGVEIIIKPETASKLADAKSKLAALAAADLSEKELYDLGEDVMGREPFEQWLQSHNPALGVRPIELLQKPDGINTLKEELLRIDYGLFS